MLCIVIAYIVIANIVIVYIVMTYIVMAYIVMAYIVTAYRCCYDAVDLAVAGHVSLKIASAADAQNARAMPA